MAIPTVLRGSHWHSAKCRSNLRTQNNIRSCFGLDIQRPGFAASLCIVEIVGRRIRTSESSPGVGCIGGLSSVSREVVVVVSVMSIILPCRQNPRFRILISPVVFLELERADKKVPPFVSCPKHSRVRLSAVPDEKSSAEGWDSAPNS